VSWQRIRGHDDLIQSFDQVVRRGRLGHAYLFTGRSGVGKRLFARELAKALLCEAPPENRLEACDRCPACHQVEAETHPDFFTAGLPEENMEVPIEVIRELCRGLSLKPARGRNKIAILNDADDLNDAAANCFLKTLEEPPPGSVLILVGTSPERQLTTIVSRCQVVRFAPLPEKTVAAILEEQGMESGPMPERLARLSNGSPGQALALADPVLWEFRQRLVEGLCKPQPDTVALGRQWIEFLEETGKDSAGQRRRASLVLRLLIDFLNDVLRVNMGQMAKSAQPEELRCLHDLANRSDPDLILELLDRCLEADMHIDRRVQLVLIVEALVDAFGQKMRVPS
jgi:DNA polymerase-3 subunit delta'